MKRPREYKEEVMPRKRRKFEPLENTLSKQEMALFTELKAVNRAHRLWTYFTSAQQASVEVLRHSANRETFNELKRIYLAAKAAREAADKIEKANEQAIKEALKNVYVPNPSNNQSFIIMFMNIGSGDCIFIKTPGGKTIVVDCGQRSTPNYDNWEKELQDVLTSATFQGGKGKPLYALILTHPDLDHYNEVKSIIQPCVSQINHVFFTLNRGDYGENTTHDYLKKAKVFSRVTINEDDVKMDSNIKEKWKKLYPASGNRIKIVDEKDCTVSLLAAEVPNSTQETKENAASIVTLIEVYGRKVLLCGDATYSTEEFLLKEHKALIDDVDVMQLEHHGSGTEHATKKFVRQVNPKLAVASSGPHKGDKNPRWVTIEKYVDPKKSKIKAAAHRISTAMDEHKLKYATEKGWQQMNTNAWFKSYLKYGLYTTESNHHLCLVIDKKGNLIREFSDSTHTHTYTISLDGTVTPKKVPRKKNG